MNLAISIERSPSLGLGSTIQKDKNHLLSKPIKNSVFRQKSSKYELLKDYGPLAKKIAAITLAGLAGGAALSLIPATAVEHIFSSFAPVILPSVAATVFFKVIGFATGLIGALGSRNDYDIVDVYLPMGLADISTNYFALSCAKSIFGVTGLVASSVTLGALMPFSVFLWATSIPGNKEAKLHAALNPVNCLVAGAVLAYLA